MLANNDKVVAIKWLQFQNEIQFGLTQQLGDAKKL